MENMKRGRKTEKKLIDEIDPPMVEDINIYFFVGPLSHSIRVKIGILTNLKIFSRSRISENPST